MKNTSKSAWIYYFLLTSCYYIVGLANIVQGPTNQTACTGALAVFTCVSSTLSTISWQINGLDPVQWNIASPLTKPLSQGSGVTSSLMLPSISAFVGASVVCNDGQENSLPALLRILGSSSPPALMTLPVNDSTSIRIHWTFGSDNVSTLSYYVTIANTSGAVMYNQSQNDDQLVYTPPDTCGSYYAVVTAMYEYLNFTCLQSSSVQLVGAYPTAPLIPTNMFLECSSMSQDNLSISISVLPQQDVCSYKIETSWKSFTTKFSPSSYVQSYPKQSIFNVSLPFNQLINLTIAAFNPYGSNSSSVNINTYEILSVTINTTYPLGRWTADCVFISCSQSIGCLVYLNDTHCAAFKRGFNNSMSVSCPVQYNDSFPGPGGYVVKAFAVHVLSNGSLYHPLAYMEFRVLTNQANTTSTTKGIGTQTNVPTIVGAVLGTVIGIVAAVITVVLIWIFRKKVHYKISTSYAVNPEQRPDATDHEMTRRNKLLGAANDSNDQQSNPPTESSNFNETQPRSNDTYHEMDETERNKLLLRAAKDGDTKQFSDLFKTSNVDVNLKNEVKQSLLMLASENGHIEIVEILISAGAKVDLQDRNKRSSLMLAAEKGHAVIVRMLLSAGANVGLQDVDESTVLHYFAKNGWLEGLKCITTNNIDVQNKFKITALHAAAKYGHTDCVKYLIENGANVNIQSVMGSTPLHRAVVSEHIDVVTFLMDVPGINVDLPISNGNTPLITASINGSLEIVELLLNKSDLAAKNNDGNTALDCAAAGGHCDVVKILMSKPKQLSSNDERSILEAAKKGDAHQLIDLISSTCINEMDENGKTPLHIIAEYGYIDCLQCLINVPGIEVNHTDKNGSTPLHLAARSGIADCVKILLSYCGIDKTLPDNSGNLPLHEAAMHCRLGCLKAFKDDFTHTGKDGNTVLHCAAQHGWHPGVKFILEHNRTIVDCQNKEGNTALHIAAIHGRSTVAKLLIQNGSDADIKNKNGKTAIDLAQENGIEDMITALVHYQHKMRSNQCTKGDAKILCESVQIVTADKCNKIGDCYTVSIAIGSHNISVSMPSRVIFNSTIEIGAIKSAMKELFELPPDLLLVSPIIWVFVSPEIEVQESIEITLPFTCNDIPAKETNITFGAALQKNNTSWEMFRFERKTAVMVEGQYGVFKTNQLCCCFGLFGPTKRYKSFTANCL